MARLDSRQARVVSLERVTAEAVWGRAEVSGEAQERRIVAYPRLSGPLAVGDTVLLNVTATALGLGTGGVDFVVHVFSDAPEKPEERGDEHIVKLRYTPLQHAISAVEQEAGWDDSATLAGVPVVACLLHSQVALVAAAARAHRPHARIAYVMTDSAALPLGFSRLVAQLRESALLDVTLTCGQAFGGERECVTLPSALLAARTVERADLVIVAPGPGNAGTGTRYGFSGIEQAWVLQATRALGGRPICCLRASEADLRPRHQGLSHHSRTVLDLCGFCPEAGWPYNTPVPTELPADLRLTNPEPGLELLAQKNIRVTSMGRTQEQDTLFFRVSAASGCV